MTAPRRALAGLGSLLVLATLLVGVPVALAVAVGWPLPHSWPTAAQIRTLLETSGIPDIVLIDVLAVICWIAWLDFVLATAVEVAAAIRGRSASRPLLARPWQAVTARLVSSIVVAVAILGTRPTDGHAPRGTALSAALVSNGSAATGTALRVSPSSSVARPEMTSTATPAPPYVVRGGDTLWGIAGESLGDSGRWPDIWHHNEDRAEPGDRHLTDPNLILPGWKLDLPATTGAASAGAGATSLPPAPAPSPPPQTQPRPPVDSGLAPRQSPAPDTATPGARPTTRPSPTDQPASGVRVGTSAFELPSGGLVGAGFAAGIVAGLAAARMHERRRRRVGSGGGSMVDRLLSPTVRHLRHAVTPRRSDGEGEADGAPAATAPNVETMMDPASGLIPVGVSQDADRVAIVDVLEVSGQSLTGPGAEGVGRALAGATLATPTLDTTGLIVVGGARRHLCGVDSIPGVEAIDEMPRAVARLEAECARRERVLRWRNGADQRALAPSLDPMATLLAIVDGPDIGGSQESLRAVIERGRPVGVAVAIVGTAPGFDVLPIAADGSTLPAPSTAVAGRLFSVSETEGAELLAVASAARGGVVAGVIASPGPGARVDDGHPAPHGGQEATAGLRRVEVLLFGPPRVVAEGTEVTTGLRGAARELLCLLAVHRAGLRQEEALAAMWPDDEDQHVGTLRVAITSTRRRLRELCGDDGQFVVLMGNRYVLEPDVVDSDLWRFETALAGASRASDSASRIEHLGAAAEAVTGEPLAGVAYEWVEPIRESVRRRAVDALGELAALRGAEGDLGGAVDALERARIVDPYCEDVYRRLMRHLGECGREDVAVRVYRELERYMATLGAQPDDATEDLVETLRARRAIPPSATSAERGGLLADSEDDGSEDYGETVTAARRTTVGRRDPVGGAPRPPATARPGQHLPILDHDAKA